MYQTLYGDQIKDDFMKNLNRMEIRNTILEVFERGSLENASPLRVEFGESVPSPSDPTRTSCGSIVPLNRWRTMMGLLEFREGQSSSSGWKTYEMGGLTSETRSEASLAKATFLEDYDWRGRTVGHSLVVHYRKRDGGFSVYSGNVEDLYEQLYHKGFRRAHLEKVGQRYNV